MESQGINPPLPTLAQDASSTGRSASDAPANPEEINLKQVKAFLAVAELRNITRAAKQLHMTQSGLSRIVGSLEQALGEELFCRTSKGLTLTSIGADFVPYARRLHDCYMDALAAATLRAGPKHFVVAACEPVLPLLLPLVIERAGSKMGNPVTLQVNGFPSRKVPDEVAASRASLGVCMYSGPHDALRFTPLLNTPLGLLASPELALPAAFDSLQDLERLPLVRMADDMMLPQALHMSDTLFDVFLRAPVIGNSLSTLFSAMAGGGLATVVSAVAASAAQAHGLRFIPLPRLLPTLQLCMVTPGESGPPAADSVWTTRVRDCILQASWLPSVERIGTS